jgi:hypothetical protein
VTWIQLRSRRDPAFWAPLLLAVLVLVPLAFWSRLWVSDWLDGLREIASFDREAARDEALRTLRLLEWAFCAVSSVFSAFLFRYFQLGLRESRLPPSGWWSLGAYRVAVGPTALRMSKFGLVLSLVLLTGTIGFVLAVEYLLRVILAGKLTA